MATEKSEKQKMLAGEYHYHHDPQLVEERKHAEEMLQKFNITTPESPERREICRMLFGSYGNGNFVNIGLRCYYGYNLFFGNNIEINHDCVFLDAVEITFGDDVFIGPKVQIYTTNHPIDPNLRKTGIQYGQKVNICKGVWIGGGAIICPGVTIGAGTIIGAGSVVTKDIPGNSLAVGNPCKVIKTIISSTTDNPSEVIKHTTPSKI